MISKEMYELLKTIPRYPKTIPYKDLISEDDVTRFNLLLEAKSPSCEYINETMEYIKRSELSLTEIGQAAIEEYEQAARNQEMIEKSLKVSRAAMFAAIASAVVAFLSLIKMLI